MGKPTMAIVQYTELIYKSGSMARKFKACREENLVGWSPPPPRWFKLNTNEALKASSGMASAGGIIKDENGIWIVGFAFHIGPGSSLLAELWGVFQGLTLYWKKGLNRIFVEVASQCVVDII